tara:strand:- start:1478 stop:1978 length:501 start_codon:yes stop_codon:yes gene_type:complete
MDKAELQNLSQILELNHQKLMQIEEQINKLDQVKQEHEIAIRSINQLINLEENQGLVPIGAGVQIPIDYTSIDSAVVDIGSGFHVESDLDKVSELLIKRTNELQDLINQLINERTNTASTIHETNHKLETLSKPESKEKSQNTPQEGSKKTKKKRRRFGTELTLDD